MLSQFRNDVEVEYLDVYNPSDEEKHTPSLYAQHVRQTIAAKLREHNAGTRSQN